MKKKLTISIISIIIPMLIAYPSFAATKNEIQNINVESREKNQQSTGSGNSQTQNSISNIQNTMANHSSIGNLDEVINVEDPFNIQLDTSIATTEKINTWVNVKASQLVRIIQTIGKWVAFIVFIISAIKTVVGVFGKSDNLSKCVTAMIISAISFVAIEYADIIFQFLLRFIVQ